MEANFNEDTLRSTAVLRSPYVKPHHVDSCLSIHYHAGCRDFHVHISTSGNKSIAAFHPTLGFDEALYYNIKSSVQITQVFISVKFVRYYLVNGGVGGGIGGFEMSGSDEEEEEDWLKEKLKNKEKVFRILKVDVSEKPCSFFDYTRGFY